MIWTSDGLVCWRIYTPLGLDKLMYLPCLCTYVATFILVRIFFFAGILFVTQINTERNREKGHWWHASFWMKVTAVVFNMFPSVPSILKVPRYRWSLMGHWGRDKMAAIFQTAFSNTFSWMKFVIFWLNFYWNLFPQGPINNIAALVQIMAWRRSGTKPLSEPMMA